MTHLKTSARTRGFTLVELLVTISIIGLIVGITFPFIASIKSGSRIQAGLNTIGMATDVARQWVVPAAWEEDTADNVEGERYSGTAALFCPTGEIRVVANFRNAQTTRGTPRYLEERIPTVNGYWDQSGVDYIQIPDGVGVAGIFRIGGNVQYLAPPFAIAFDEYGHLHFGDFSGNIYYNSNARNGFELTQRRSASYNPSDWDGNANSNNAELLEASLVRELPFEAIECVPGVVIYDLSDFEDAGFSFAGGGRVTLNSPAGDWLKENGQTLFFSPHTGTALKDETK